jgi:hypothetical protein
MGGSGDGGGGDGGSALGGSGMGGSGQGGVAGLGGRGAGGTAAGGSVMSGSSLGGSAAPGCQRFPNAQEFMNPTDLREHCYWLHTDVQTWAGAEAACETDGGYLATVTSDAENKTIVSTAKFGGTRTLVWLGGTDDRSDTDASGPGTYRWITLEPWLYVKWLAGQPDGACTTCTGPPGAQFCTCDHRMTMQSDGQWLTGSPDARHNYICEGAL